MKLLPCRTPSCAGKGALLPASRAYPRGEPYVAASHVGRVTCARCKRVTELSVAEFNRLPNLKLDDLEDLTPGRALKDIVGAGFAGAQAADLFQAGLQDATALHALERGQEGERQIQEALANGLQTAGPES
jgi:hypothetical protein